MRKNLFLITVVTATLAIAGPASAGFSLNKLIKKGAAKKAEPKAEAMPPSPTCNSVSNVGLCYGFNGPHNKDQKTSNGNEMACKFMKGRFLASDSCPMDKAFGRCVVKGGTPDEYSLFYYQGGRFIKNAADAQKDCASAKSGIHAQGAGVWHAL